MHETQRPHPAAAPDLPGSGPAHEGVGARQDELLFSSGGGGYLNECTSPELLEEAKLREFSDMRLPSVWIGIATMIGYENFLKVWRALDTAAENGELRMSDSESMIIVSLRRYSSFRRYQRNRWIESLAGRGLPPALIQQMVKQQLGENLTRSHIRRLSKGQGEVLRFRTA